MSIPKLTVKTTTEADLHIDAKGRFRIDRPQIVDGSMTFGPNKVSTLRYICQSAYMMKDGTIDVCRNPFKTVVGRGTGDQTEIVECGKCRTQYIVRSKYSALGSLEVQTSVWDIGRKIAAEGFLWTDKSDYTSYIKFNLQSDKNNVQ